MATLVNITLLAVMARRPIEPDDEFALLVLSEASGLVCDTAQHPEWEQNPANAPRTARRICLQVAYRTFTNPEFEVQYGLGPLSGRSLDLYAMGLNLTEHEQEQLEALQGATGGAQKGLWVQPLDGGVAPDLTVYARDRAYPLSNPIPFLTPEDAFLMTPLED